MTFNAIHKTLSILDNLQKQVLTQNVFKLLQDLLKSLQCAIEEINVALRIDKFKQFHVKIKLCASQLTKTLPSLVDIVKGVQNADNKEVSDFLIEKIRWCLLEVLRLFSGGGSEADGEPSGMFVKTMDEAICTLQTENSAIDANFRKSIDELLCQALTIAKLSINEDYEEISAGCKNVLVTLSNLTDFTRTPENSLKADALLSSLEILERRVNIAVLRLFLHLAADPNLPLKQLTLKALDKRYKPRHISDLSTDLESLDLYCEQIQLMGNFAVACSNDSQLKVKILCCLASIEFCENFFHSSYEEFYITPSDYNKKGFFKFIVDEYQKEMKELTFLLDCVVDTETFVQVALSDLNPLAQDIKESIEDNIFNKRDAEVFLSRCIRLTKHLYSAQDDTLVANSRIFDAIKEFESILKQYQTCLRTNVLNLRSMQEVTSRMDAALFVIHRISCLLSTCRNSMSQVTNASKIRLRKTFVNNVSYTSENNILKPYLAKVKETPRMKSSLYVVTPKKTPKAVPMSTMGNITGISDVLDNIHDFPDTFASLECAQDEEDDDDRKNDTYSVLHSQPNYDLKSLGANSLSLSESHFGIDTVGRIEDLMLLDIGQREAIRAVIHDFIDSDDDVDWGMEEMAVPASGSVSRPKFTLLLKPQRSLLG